ncbi:recombinase RecT [Streptomyces sp. NPDC008240]|uniref:recombinase RecT n=1 Tax=Streptomyces sp. NPDC008240 TaxID=3364822 RepID=UPI0036EA75D3
MSAEIVKHQPAAPVAHRGGALSLGHMTPHEAWLFCQSLADTPLLPDAYRRNPASVLWAMEYGRALGLDVVTTINTIHVIKGKPTQSADLMLSRAREAGHRVRIRQEPGSCTASIWRSDDPEFENTITWTYDDAVTAGLCELRNGQPYSRSSKGEKQSWEKYPRAMLRARAISECVRTACPEVLHGAIYTPEELGARVDAEGMPVEAEVHQLRRVQPGEGDPWATPTKTDAGDNEFSPDPKAQKHANQAAEHDKGQDHIKARWAIAAKDSVINGPILAPDTKQQDVLGTYLARLAKTLPETAPGGVPAADVVDVEIVGDNPEAEAAERDLRAAAERVGLDNLDEEFEESYGLPIAQAGAAQLRAMTAILTGSAA